MLKQKIRKLSIVVDAFPKIGTGHLMRCLALAQGWNNAGGSTTFFTYCESNHLLARIKDEGFMTHVLEKPGDIEIVKALLKKKEETDWLVLDGYHFNGDFQKSVREYGKKLMVIDDYAHLNKYYGDIILNQNYQAEEFSYNVETSARLLLGTKFALLRKEFLVYKDSIKNIPDRAKNILITLGGADPDNNTLRVIRAVNLIKKNCDIKVIIGPSNPHYDSIQREIRKGIHDITILTSVDNMAPLLAWADLSISAGGTTVWELAFMGLPSILCIVAENQKWSVNKLNKDGIFQSLGWIKDASITDISDMIENIIDDKNSRMAMYRMAREAVDGKGIDRVIRAMKDLEGGSKISCNLNFEEIEFKNFVDLSNKEKELVLKWRNSVEIRRWMFTDHIISREEHFAFIESLKRNKNNYYWMVIIRNRPAGVGSIQRIDFTKKIAYLGIYAWEKGTGRLIFNKLLYIGFNILDLSTLFCELMENNALAKNFYEAFGLKLNKPVRLINKQGTPQKVISMSISKNSWKSQVNKNLCYQ